VVVDHVEREIRRSKPRTGAVLLAHVAVVEVQTRARKILVVKSSWLAPVGDDGSPEKALRPRLSRR